jgi:hypothetical protein
MPQKILCAACGLTLYDGLELESPLEIIQRHNGLCPQCKKSLTFDVEAIKIVPSQAK